MIIRQFAMDDYEQVRQLWQICKLPLTAAYDGQDAICKKLERDPDLFLVAEENKAILGVVMGTWDGREASIYNQCVEPRFRRTGIGSQLVKEVERRLKDKGATKISLLVDKDNLDAQDFFEAHGYQMDDRQVILTKELT